MSIDSISSNFKEFACILGCLLLIFTQFCTVFAIKIALVRSWSQSLVKLPNFNWLFWSLLVTRLSSGLGNVAYVTLPLYVFNVLIIPIEKTLQRVVHLSLSLSLFSRNLVLLNWTGYHFRIFYRNSSLVFNFVGLLNRISKGTLVWAKLQLFTFFQYLFLIRYSLLLFCAFLFLFA